jgi:outer membrane lipoprotein-sorting protein
MIGVKSIIACSAVIFLLALTQSAWAQTSPLEELQTKLKGVQSDMLAKNANFDKAGSNVTTEQVTEGGVKYNVTIYKDKNGNILREYTGPDGKKAIIRTISSGNGPVLTITYNPDGTVAKQETFEPIGLKKYTEINNPDGTKTEITQDASLSKDNTLTTKLDANGNVISKTISTSPGLPEGCTFCTVTGQYECKKPA